METVTVATIVSSIGTFFTSAMTWAGSVLSTIISSPLLLIFATLSISFVGIGVVRRLMSIR